MRNNKLKTALTATLALICVVSAAVCCSAYTKKAAEEARYEELRETVRREPETEAATKAAAVSAETVPAATVAETEEAYTAPTSLSSLMAENKAVIGWLSIDDTRVDYPICQDKTDNEFFLHHDIDGVKSDSGSIYMDANHDIDADGLHVIYGHHMKSGSMFKDVSRFVSADYMRAHQSISIWTGTKTLQLKPVYCYAGVADGSYRGQISDPDELHKFIKDKAGIDIDSDNIFVLITCSYGSKDERTYLICEEESV